MASNEWWRCITPRRIILAVSVLILSGGGANVTAASSTGPSRPPVKGCAWEKIRSDELGLEAWVQRCDFGFRQISFLFAGQALAIRYSDGGDPDPLVEVLDLLPGESATAGLRRIFLSRTPAAIARRCELARYRYGKTHGDALRYTFVPDRQYRKELQAAANPDEVGDPPCGDWGEAPDGIQYFEVSPSNKVRKVLFVRVGQDEPLFDEASLRLIAPLPNSSSTTHD